jgi:ATP-dependent DNA ligase
MPLVRVADAFDHEEWMYELKLDGFRALAFIDGHHCRLVSRNGHTQALAVSERRTGTRDPV